MTSVASEKRLTAVDLRHAIDARYEPPEWHLEREVTLAGRRLDIVALNLWGARDYRIVGFELKVDRGDWLRELADFRKTDEWCAVVDQFYVVTPPKLIKAEELPEGWGHLELCGSKMMTRRHAAMKTGTTLPREVAARFIGRLADALRRRVREEDIAIRNEIADEIEKRLRDQLQRSTENERQANEKTKKDYRTLLDALGLQPHDWGVQERALKAAAVFAATRGGRTDSLARQLEENARALEAHLHKLRDAAVALRTIEATISG